MFHVSHVTFHLSHVTLHLSLTLKATDPPLLSPPLSTHPAVNLKSKETVSCCIILVGCIESSAQSCVGQHQPLLSELETENVIF